MLFIIIKVNLLKKDFEVSLEFFNKLIEIDPFRFENMDTFSNILYIKEK